MLVDVNHHSETARTRMTVSGEVDSVTADQLEKAFLDAVRHHQPSHVEVNIEGVTYLDSTGIRALVLCQAGARAAGCRLILVKTPPAVYRVLETTSLLDHFGVHEAG
ncbi:STAS domain-containing protein [Actinoplanes sp. TFC3]|uniref:STAS domain-containing protein n=1 Tax=Actinoplanes sp. TFC3 TaxID=1710355 RepID=UPI001379F5D4|nr:STAS domain-containing protein [Actinoplanes sp. TFC3]